MVQLEFVQSLSDGHPMVFLAEFDGRVAKIGHNIYLNNFTIDTCI